MRTSKESVGLLTGSIRGLTAGVRNLGIVMTGASALAGAAMLTLSRRAARVEEAFAEVDTISREVSDSQEEYGELISRLNTEFGAHTSRLQSINALYQSLSAGIDEGVENQEQFLETATKLSVVGLAPLEETVDVLSTILNAYNLEVEDSERVSEALFRTVQFGKVTLEELTPVMGRVSAQASELNVQIEETGAAMSVLTARGFESRIAATGLRNVMRDMMRPSEELGDMFRDIAAENDFFADSMEDQQDHVRGLAQRYRDATSDLEDYQTQLEDARDEIDDNNLIIQEARLLQEAIEQDRRDEIEDTISEFETEGKTIEDLDDIIDEHRLNVQEARVQEEQHRQTIDELEDDVADIKQEFREEIEVAGDLEEGIGNLVLENQGFVDTLTDVNEAAEEQGIQMSELFPQTRSLQAVLALTSDDGEALSEVFSIMDGEVDDTSEAVENLSDEFEDLTEEEIEAAIDGLDEMDEMWEDMSETSSAQFRDALSELGESAENLGEIFMGDLSEAISDLTGFINGITERLENLDDEVKSNIGTFAVLATSIGLVLGPLLLFLGQIGLIASAMGVGLIPFLGIAGTLFGTLAFSLEEAASDSEDADELLSDMGDTLDSLIDFVKELSNIFREELLPGLQDAGEGFLDVLTEIFSSLTEESDEGESVLRQFASFVGNAFSELGNFLSENSEEIGDFVTFLVDSFINDVIPALKSFADSAKEFAEEEVIPALESFAEFITETVIPEVEAFAEFVKDEVLPEVEEFAELLWDEGIPALESLGEGLWDVIESLIEFAKSDESAEIVHFLQESAEDLLIAITDLIETTGEFLSENDDLITDLIIATAVFFGVIKPLFKLKSALIPLIPAFKFFAKSVVVSMGTLKALIAGLKGAPVLMLTLKGIIATLGAALAAIGGPITLLIIAVGLLAAMWATNFMGIRDAINDLLGSVKDFAITTGEFLWFVVDGIIRLVDWFLYLGGESATLMAISEGLAIAFEEIINVSFGIVEALTSALDIFSGLMKIITGDTEEGKEQFISGVRGMFDAVEDVLLGLPRLFLGILLSTVGIVAGLMVDIAIAAAKGMGELWSRIREVTPGPLDVLDFFIQTFGKPIASGISQGIDKIVDFLSGLWGDIRDVLPTKEDIKETFEETFIEPIKEVFDEVKEFLIGEDSPIVSAVDDLIGEDGVLNRIVDWFGDLPDNVKDAIPSDLDDISEIGRDVASSIISGVTSIISDFTDLVDIDMDDAKEWGENLIEEIAEGIRNAGNLIKDAIRDAAGELARFLPNSPADEGPLSRSGTTPEDSGRSLMQGVASGIRSEPIGPALDDSLHVDEPTVGTTAESHTSSSDDDKKTEINVEEGAIKFEEGAFQGVSDEELPRKVNREIEESFDEMIDRIESSGGRVSKR